MQPLVASCWIKMSTFGEDEPGHAASGVGVDT